MWLLWMVVQTAWAQPVEAFAVDFEATSLVADTTTVVAVGETQSVRFERVSGETSTLEWGARSAELVTFPGLGQRGLVTCGADGVALHAWPSGEEINRVPGACRAMANTGSAASIEVVVADSELAVLTWTGDAWTRRPLEDAIPADGDLLLSAMPGRVAWAIRGESGIREISARGVSELATEGGVGGLSNRDGLWIWTHADLDTIEGQLGDSFLSAREPRALQVVDLNDDGVDDLLVQHTDRLGVVVNEAEVLVPWRGRIDGFSLDDASCPSGWLATEGRVLRFDDLCELVGPATGQEPVPEAPSASIAPELTEEIPKPTRVPLYARGMQELDFEVGKTGRALLVDAQRPWTWLQVAGGPPGWNVTPGGEVIYRPEQGDEGVYSATVILGSGTFRRTASLTIRVKGPGSSEVEPEPTRLTESDYRYRPRGAGMACYFSGGMAGAISRVPALTWDLAGRGLVLATASPSIDLGCVTATKPSVRLGLRSSPWLGYASAGGDYLVPAALVTLGPSFGKKNLTGSPYLAMGAVAFGVGGRVSWLPWNLRYGKRFGLSADVMTFLPVGLGFAGSLEWTVQL